ncbi:MAG: cyclic pyranopterin monophosphate synthase MoaC [Treponema sp.]|nr:cyclic pyranopterin monophosphate synthase MoaC [Treponema sp.]
MNSELSHFDCNGNAVMMDVSGKTISRRTAAAKGSIVMSEQALKSVCEGTSKKGDVFGTARIAGIMAAKKCADLIPLCHTLNLEKCTVDFTVNKDKNEIECFCEVLLNGKTGAEMEALTGVSVSLLAIYDMCKSIDKAMVIGNIKLIKKSGGKSDYKC